MSSTAKKPKVINKIRPPQRKSTTEVFDEAWAILNAAIIQIYKKNASSLRFEELYRNAYNIVMNKAGDKLYDNVKQLVAQLLKDLVHSQIITSLPQMAENGDLMNVDLFFSAINSVWKDHTMCMLMIRDVLMYLDRTYVSTSSNPRVYDMGLDLFRDIVFFSDESTIKPLLIRSLLFQIEKERKGTEITRDLVRIVINIMLSLNGSVGEKTTDKFTISVYSTEFESLFLEASLSYWSQEAAKLISELNPIQYLTKVEELLKLEAERMKFYLVESTQKQAIKLVENELIVKNFPVILESKDGFELMFKEKMIPNIHSLYLLYSRVSETHELLRSRLYQCIVQSCEEISNIYASNNKATTKTTAMESDKNDQEQSKSANPAALDPIKWVESIITLKQNLDEILENAFDRDKLFLNEVNSGMEYAFDQVVRSPEFLSLFIDDCLKRGARKKTDEQVDQSVNAASELFRFIKNKDVFERYYKQHLARRLINSKNISEDAERNVIAKLKVESGSHFTSKLEGMFNDIKTSQDLNTHFRTLPSNQENRSFDLAVNILTSTNWPINSYSGNCIYPTECRLTLEKFQKFYDSKYTGRRLTWMPNLGQADVRANFPKGKKEINMSTFAMTVLVSAFNGLSGDEWISYPQIQEITDIPDLDLKRTLQSLSVAKFKILVKSSKGKDIHPDDKFKVNEDFSSQLVRFKILTISSSSGGGSVENEEDRSETVLRVDQDRKNQVEAAIVRIMKSRKTLDHNNLVAEVIKQMNSRFQANPTMVKQRIEALIEREFLERDSNDRKLYHYVA